MSQNPPTLSEILRREDFTKELSRAAQISHECQGEAHFIVYLMEDNRVQVNEAIAGEKELHPLNETIPEEELTDGHYNYVSPEESDPNYKHEEGKGGHITPFGRRLIGVHFHPPKGSLIASPGDVGTLNRARIQDDNIGELLSSNDSPFIEHTNPLEVVGHIVNDNPSSYQLLTFQETAEEPLDFHHGFMTEVAERINKITGEDTMPRVHEIFGFRDHFDDADEFAEFLNSIGLHRAGVFKVSGRDYSDLDRMEMFEPLVRRETLENDDEDDDFDEDFDDD